MTKPSMLSREEELFLIELGKKYLIGLTAKFQSPNVAEHHQVPWNKGLHRTKKLKWSKEQHRKFAATMKKKWAEKRKEKVE